MGARDRNVQIASAFGAPAKERSAAAHARRRVPNGMGIALRLGEAHAARDAACLPGSEARSIVNPPQPGPPSESLMSAEPKPVVPKQPNASAAERKRDVAPKVGAATEPTTEPVRREPEVAGKGAKASPGNPDLSPASPGNQPQPTPGSSRARADGPGAHVETDRSGKTRPADGATETSHDDF
jgi:hypothetical protein